jgi:hypothetical protein
MFNWFRQKPQPRAALLTHSQHYDETALRAKGEKRELTIVHVKAEGSFLNLVYQWKDSLSDKEADNLDTRARAYIVCAIYDAAKTAGLACDPGPLHGQRPSWLIGGGRTPISLVNAGFDMSDKTCFMQVGPGMVAMTARQQGENLPKLAAGFQAQFSRIAV